MIQLSNVRFRWRRQDPMVIDIPSFDVAAGERIFVKGPSGSGKTTLLNLLAGVAVPESGAIRIMGTDIVGIGGARRDAFRANHIGFIFQMFNLVPYLSIVENVVLPCRFSSLRRQRVLERGQAIEAEARRLLMTMDLDIDALADRPVSRLSMGQQQRVAAARSLIGVPELVIADEPTSSLDEDARSSFLDLLFREVDGAGSTMLFVSHDARLANAFDRSVALDDINCVRG